jgi:hypothetical protein
VTNVSVGRIHQPRPHFRLGLVLMIVFQLVALAIVLYNLDASAAANLGHVTGEGVAR